MQLLEAEILRFSHLRDRASDMGRRKEYPYLLKLSISLLKMIIVHTLGMLFSVYVFELQGKSM